MIPAINNPIKVTRKTASTIDHILTNYFTETVFKTAIFKSDKFCHFLICFLIPSSSTQKENKTNLFIKKIFNTESFESFEKKLYKTAWEETLTSKTLCKAYTTFLQKFIVLYDKIFS